MKAFPFSSILSLILIPALVMTPMWAQAPSADGMKTAAVPDELQIRVLNADGLNGGVPAGAKQTLAVQVTDATGAAVANAAVTCRLPDGGATGSFADGSHAAVVYTDAQGRATIDGLQWGREQGDVAIRLTANKGTDHTGILIETRLVVAVPAKAAAAASAAKIQPSVGQPVVKQAVVAQPVVAQPVVAQATPSQPAQPVIAEPEVTVSKPSRQPGQTVQQAAIAQSGANPAPNPGPNPLTPTAAPTTPDPTVSVSRTSASDAPHSSHAKWYLLAAVAVAAGAGAAFAMKGKSSSTSSSNTSSISIGSPSISVGHP